MFVKSIKLITISAILSFVLNISYAESPNKLSLYEIILNTKDSFLKTSDTNEIKSIQAWCTDYVSALSVHERTNLLTEMLKKMENKESEKNVNELLAKVKLIDEINKHISSYFCNPNYYSKT